MDKTVNKKKLTPERFDWNRSKVINYKEARIDLINKFKTLLLPDWFNLLLFVSYFSNPAKFKQTHKNKNQCLILSSSDGDILRRMHRTTKMGTQETATIRATFQTNSKSIWAVFR